MLVLPFVLSLVLVYAPADRFCGGGLGWSILGSDNGGPLPGRPVWYITPIVLVITASLVLLMGLSPWLGVLTAGSWLLYRALLPWKLGDSSAMTPKLRFRDLLWSLFRHGLAFYPPALWMLGTNQIYKCVGLLGAGLVYAALRTGLGLMLSEQRHTTDYDPNAGTELASGAIYGLIAGMLFLSWVI